MSNDVFEQSMIEFAPDRSTAGFRLHTCEIYNWGTFHGRVCRISPGGRTALLTGANGAGKSTLADAILTLFIDSRKRNYNQASAGGGDRKPRKERTERDYILGTHSEKHDADYGVGRPEQLRKAGESVSILLARFHNETFNTHVTLAQVLWVTPGGKIDRAFVVAKQALSIAGDLNPESLGGPSEVRQRLRERGLEPLDTFSEYSRRFHEALFLDLAKSPMDIFNQAICIKDISDLTSFIRQYMLDDGGAARKLAELRANFEELRTIYERIERETRRLKDLNAIRDHHREVLTWQESLQHWGLVREAAALFFAEKESELRTEQGNQWSLERTRAENEKMRDDAEAGKQAQTAKDLEFAIQSSDAGRRLQEIDKDIEAGEAKVSERKPRHERFHAALRQWRPHASVTNEREFESLTRAAREELPKMQEESEEIAARIQEQSQSILDNEKQQELVNTEIRHLLASKGNIPKENADIRRRLAEALRVELKTFPFVGELVQVRETEAAWAGAIERLARSFGLSILIPEKWRAAVDTHVHQTHQRGLIVYHAVPPAKGSPPPSPSPGSAASKLEVHPDANPFAGWLQRELNHRFDHECHAEPGEAFHRARKALTRQGLIKQAGAERRKDDRHGLNDPSRHILGWDNAAKVNALESKQQELRAAEAKLRKGLEESKSAEKALRGRIKGLEDCQMIASRWVEMDFATPAAHVEALRREAAEIRRGSERLNALKNRLKEAKQQEAAARKRAESAAERIGELKSRIQENTERLAQCSTIIDAANSRDDGGKAFRERFAAIRELLGIPVTATSALAAARDSVNESIREKESEARGKHATAMEKTKSAMQAFVSQVRTEDPRMHDELHNEDLKLHGYHVRFFEPFDAIRHRIETEDLPKNQSRFERLLQNNLIEDVANFDGLLTNHADTIKRRIDELNRHLREVDFDRLRHTYIQLVPARNSDSGQKHFRNLRQYALEDSAQGGDADEDRRDSFKRVKSLIDELAKDERWTQRVIDVRNWFDFRADEFFRKGDEYRQSYTGASGKSGGEKNRLASTILATSIAYQYGISVDDERQSDTFRLVVVDEMFSKTDDEFSTYLLDLFKQFHLQLIIIQPLDSKIHLVEKYVERYHIVTRPEVVSNIKDLTVHEYRAAMKELATS